MGAKTKSLSIGDWSRGTDLSRSEKLLKPGKNIQALNMIYNLEGGAKTARQYENLGIDWGEDDKGIDGLYIMDVYPDILWVVVNGKLKYADLSLSTPVVYEADTAFSFTAGEPCVFAEYRNSLYIANGVDNMARIAVSKLASALNTDDLSLEEDLGASTYKWTASGSGTDEYYLELSGAGGDPDLTKPLQITENDVVITEGTVGSLSASEWDFGDNDSLGFDTVYVRIADGADPDTKADDYLEAFWAQVQLEDATGFNFNNAVDKVYIEGDEIDYEDVSSSGVGDMLEFATNIDSNHTSGSLVTQYNTITAPSGGSIKAKTIAIWKNTLWYSAGDEPGIVRYGKTIANFGHLTSGNLHDFSDGNNVASAEGGEITALFAAGDGQGNRLYMFEASKVWFLSTYVTSAGAEAFTPVKLFTQNYGCPNPFCVISMENVVIFWTGNRTIQIRYEPDTAQLVPDETFDEDLAEEFRKADNEQAIARLHYNETDKRVYVTFQKDNLRTTAVRDNKRKRWAYPWDFDPVLYVKWGKYTLFGDPDNDKVYKLGEALSADGKDVTYRLFSGRIAGSNRNHKLFTKGRIEGRLRRGTSISFGVYVDNNLHGGFRPINETTADITSATEDSVAVGLSPTGQEAVGGEAATDSGFVEFTYHFTVGRRGPDIAFSWSTLDNGSEWEINYAEIQFKEYDKKASKHY